MVLVKGEWFDLYTQKLILNSFGFDETDIKKRAEEYGKLLNISQSYISKEAQDNGEEEDD